MESVFHLRRNHLVTCRQESGGYVVGYGSRLLELATRWGIAMLPVAEDQQAASGELESA